MLIGKVHSEYPDTTWYVEIDTGNRLRARDPGVKLRTGPIGLPGLTPTEARALSVELERAADILERKVENNG